MSAAEKELSSSSDNGLFDESEEEAAEVALTANKDEDDFEEVSTKDAVSESVFEAEIPELEFASEPKDKIFQIKVPGFLYVNSSLYQRPTFIESTNIEIEKTKASDSHTAQWQYNKLNVDNTIRWRRSEGELQSNAKLIEWDDGTFGLLLNNDIYDFTLKPLQKTQTYLGISHADAGIVEVKDAVTYELSVMPISLTALTFRKLQENMNKTEKTSGVLEIVTDQDPEKRKREMDQLENERIRARRRLESKRRQQLSQYDDDENLLWYKKFSNDIEKDENEDEDRRQRLRNIKMQGAAMDYDSSDAEENQSHGNSGSDLEHEAHGDSTISENTNKSLEGDHSDAKRNLRRVIASDSEDED